MSFPERELSALLQRLSYLGVPLQPEDTSTALRHPVLQNSSELMEGLKDELQRIRAVADREKELGPAPRPNMARYPALLGSFISRKKFEESLKRNTGFVSLKQAFVGREKHYSTKPISLLSRNIWLVTLRDMLVRKIHLGRYLLCRVIAPASRVVAIEAIVEDPEGDVQLLSLYNFPSMLNAGADEIDGVFPVGAILAIREPYLKFSLQCDNAFIRVDSPSDVVFPGPTSEILKCVTWMFGPSSLGAVKVPSTALGWKEDGNRHFKAAHWLAAAIAYTKGLDLDPSDVVLRANRAESYLRLEYFSAALFDAENVLQSSDPPENIQHKCLFRAGKAAYAQDNFKKAVHYFQKYRACNPNDVADVNSWICRAVSCFTQQQNGRYDWAQIFIESRKSNSAMDMANYVGPVEIVNIPSRGGRGMVATKDINVGELLVVAKPFAAVFPEELSLEKILGINIVTKEMVGPCKSATLIRIVEKIYGNPELHDLVYHLCPGPSYPSPPATYPPPITASHSSDRNPLNSSIDIDVALLENICSLNLFRAEPLDYAQSSSGPDTAELDSPCALYLLPALINHSCFENSNRIFFREVMVIRAKTNIRKGEEITLAYTWGDTALTRQEQLNKYNFTCTCILCENDRADGEPACRRREALVNSLSGLDQGNQKTVPVAAKSYGKTKKALELVITQVSETYTPSHKTAVRPPLVFLCHRLSQEIQAHAHRHDPRLHHQAVSEEINAIEAMGISVIDKSTRNGLPSSHQRNKLPIKTDRGPLGGGSCVIMALTIVGSFLALKDHLRAERWLRAAWWLENIFVGGGRKLFEERYKSILQGTEIGLWGKGIKSQRTTVS